VSHSDTAKFLGQSKQKKQARPLLTQPLVKVRKWVKRTQGTFLATSLFIFYGNATA